MRAPLTSLVAALAVAFGVTLYWGVDQHQALVRERASASGARNDLDDVTHRLRSSERALLAAETSIQGLHAMDSQRLFTSGHTVASPETIEQFYAAADADPLWGPFHHKLERRRILARYTILFSALKIPSDSLVPLEELLVERAILNRRASHQQHGADGKLDGPQTSIQSSRILDAKIVKLVGDEAARLIREWSSAIYYYGNAPDGSVAQDAVTLMDAGFSLSTDQMVKLALIRHEVLVLHPEPLGDPGAKSVDPTTRLTPVDERLLDREREVLSAKEVSILRDWTSEERKARMALEKIKMTYHIESDRNGP